MTTRFADTSYYLAITNPRDQFHRAATSLADPVFAKVVTTQFVLMEVGDALSDPADRPRFHSLVKGLAAAHRELEIIPASDTLFRRGFELHRSRADKFWSLTDCISFAIMRERGLTEALTADHHFEQAGFVALLAHD